MTTATVTIEVEAQSLNADRREHWTNRDQLASEVREHAGWAAIAARLPRFAYAHVIVVQPYQRSGTTLHDAGNDYPTAKAIIDGLVDVKVLPGDSPSYVDGVLLKAPKHAPRSYMDITIDGTLAPRQAPLVWPATSIKE